MSFLYVNLHFSGGRNQKVKRPWGGSRERALQRKTGAHRCSEEGTGKHGAGTLSVKAEVRAILSRRRSQKSHRETYFMFT